MVVAPHGLCLEEVAYPPDPDLAARAQATRRLRPTPPGSSPHLAPPARRPPASPPRPRPPPPGLAPPAPAAG